MKFCVYECYSEDERRELESKNLYVYELRSTDDGDWFGTIEPRVRVNNCGGIVTNEPIIFPNERDQFVDYEEFCSANEEVDDLEDLKEV